MISQSSLMVKNPSLFWRFFAIGFLLVTLYFPFQAALNLSPEVDLASGRVLVLALFSIWLFGSLASKKPLFIFTFLGFGLIMFWIVSTLSLLMAQEFGWGLRKLLFFLSLFPLFFMTVSLASYLFNFKKIVKVTIWAGIIAALLGLIQFLSQFWLGSAFLVDFYARKLGPVFWGKSFSALVAEHPSWFAEVSGQTLMRAFGLFPDPHMMAFFLGLILPIVFALFLFKEKGQVKLFIICLLLFFVLLLTFSRGGYLGILLGGGAVLFLSWPSLGENKKFLLMVGLILSALIFLIFAQPITDRFLSSFFLSEGSTIGRLKIWQDAWRVFLTNPLLGVGLGNYPREVEPLVSYRSPITSHNLYLDILAETGFFGFASWLLLIFGSLFILIKKIKTAAIIKKDRFLMATTIGLVGSLVYFAVHSFFETAIFNPTILAFLMINLGLIGAIAHYESLN